VGRSPAQPRFCGGRGGQHHSLGLRADGSIAAWGYNYFGQCDVPFPNNGFVAVAAGSGHNLALKTDGSIAAWGYDRYGQCAVPLPNSGFLAIAAGTGHSLALKTDGSVVAWGDNSLGQCAVPSPNSGFVAIAAGAWHSLGLKADGSIVAWGDNSQKQCEIPLPNTTYVAISAGEAFSLALEGQGALQVTLAPPEILAKGGRWRLSSEASDVWHDDTVYDPLSDTSSTIMRAGVGVHTLTFKEVQGWTRPADQTLEVTDSGTLQVTGAYQQIFCTLSTSAEHGTVQTSPTATTFPLDTPVTLTAVPDPGYLFVGWTGDIPPGQKGVNPLPVVMDRDRQIVANFLTTEVEKGTLSVEVTGQGSVTVDPDLVYYALGTTLRLTATPAPGYRFVRWEGDVPGGEENKETWVLMMTASKTVRAVFEEITPTVSSFKINNGAVFTANPAVTLPNVCADATSATHSYLASESADFTSATWQPYASVPLFVLSPEAGEKTVYFKVKDSAGLESPVTSDTIVLSASGHIVVPFGNNAVHQSDAPSPATDFVSVAAGTGYSLGLKASGSIVAWGNNTYNKCDVPEPNSGFAAIAAGHYHSLGLKSDGSIVAWGLNDYNQCTVPQPNREFVAVSAGYLHNIALKADGSVVTWGLNNYGQCGSFEPNVGFVAVAAGYAHNLALRADGSIRAWGKNEWGQCTVPEPNRDFIAIAAGWEHSLGLKADGSIVAWGYNYSGQCDVPSPNTGFVAVAAGYTHSLGLKADGTIVAWGRNDSGECNVPAPNKDYTAIAGGLNHSLALKIEGSVKVTLTPPEAVAAGARWRLSTLEKGTWHDESEYDPTWVWNQSDDIVTPRPARTT
jgi:alpha-tubulin suppressor-like RCC1 family protein